MFKGLRNMLTNKISCLEGMIMEESSSEELFEDIILGEEADNLDNDNIDDVIGDDMIDVDDVESEDKIEDSVFGTVIFPDNKKEIEELVDKIPDDAPKHSSNIDNEIKKELDNKETHNHIPTVDELNDEDEEEEDINESTNLLDSIMGRF